MSEAGGGGGVRGLEEGLGCRFGAGRRRGSGDLGVCVCGPRGRAVEGVERDWQAWPAEQRHRRTSAQRARALTRWPHWAERERADELAGRGADRTGPHGGESGEGGGGGALAGQLGRKAGIREMGFFSFLIYS